MSIYDKEEASVCKDKERERERERKGDVKESRARI